MPEGVDVVVEDGFATIEFVDRSLRGAGLAKLLEVGTPPELIEKVTRPRVAYTVPEGNAREAGLLDESDEDPSEGDDAGSLGAWPEGEPDDDWKRPELDAYAKSKGIDADALPNKDAVLDAIRKAQQS